MAIVDLSAQLSGHVFHYLLAFARLGSGIMLFPGIGETYVPARLRLALAFCLGFVVYPILLPLFPPVPNDLGTMTLLISKEILVGLFFGSVLRLLMDVLETAGSIVAVQMGLSNAMILNPTLGSQSTIPSSILTLTGIALLFATGLDHHLLRGLIETYRVFPPTETFLLGDAAQWFAKLTTRCFMAGVELGAPFLVIGILMYVALGMIQRMMPQIQLFIVVLPLQIWGGMMLFAGVVTAMAVGWLNFFDGTFAEFMRG
jgi:flagellar biosynthetic protein FliR